jgi:hypothetical protein
MKIELVAMNRLHTSTCNDQLSLFFYAMMIMLNRKCHLNVIGTARRVLPSMKQGSQILLGTTYQNGKNIPKDHQIGIRNDHKMYQIFFNTRTSKIYQNWVRIDQLVMSTFSCLTI